MIICEKLTIEATSSSGNLSEATAAIYSGLVHAIRYVLSTGTAYSTDATLSITATVSGATVFATTDLTSSATYYPRLSAHTTTGGTSTQAAHACAPPLGRESLTVAVTAAAANSDGVFYVFVDGGRG